MIKKSKIGLKFTGGGGLFHASRVDIGTLIIAINALEKKVNELIEVINH